ncbi:MAG: BrnT family toxin [Selenomonadaceae bacterium]|nr:BrnT family toxin [Selenomonadaceae bacterium]
MDINYKLVDLKFVWDSVKAEKNVKKHGIYFEDAVLVFFDENRFEDYDNFNSDDEDRFKIIGKVEKILVVKRTGEIL